MINPKLYIGLLGAALLIASAVKEDDVKYQDVEVNGQKIQCKYDYKGSRIARVEATAEDGRKSIYVDLGNGLRKAQLLTYSSPLEEIAWKDACMEVPGGWKDGRE